MQQRFQRLVAEISDSVRLELKRAQREIVIIGLGCGLSIVWRYHYANSLDHSKLTVGLWDRHPPFPGVSHFEPPKRLSVIEFDFDITPSEAYVWRQSSGADTREFGTEELASFILKNFMDEAPKRKPSILDED